jgi:hypothetical protein
MTEEPDFIYSGVVNEDDALNKDFLWIRIQRSIDDGRTLLIQSSSHLPVKFEVRLTEKQTDSLYRCLHNAIRCLAEQGTIIPV